MGSISLRRQKKTQADITPSLGNLSSTHSQFNMIVNDKFEFSNIM